MGVVGKLSCAALGNRPALHAQTISPFSGAIKWVNRARAMAQNALSVRPRAEHRWQVDMRRLARLAGLQVGSAGTAEREPVQVSD